MMTDDRDALGARLAWCAARREHAEAYTVDEVQIGAAWKNEGRWTYNYATD